MVVLRNCGESESDKGIEYSEQFECFNFPPSPTYFPPWPTTFPPSPSYFPLYSPPSPPLLPSSSNSSVRYVWDAVVICLPQNDLDIVDLPDFHLVLAVEHKIQDRGGALDVIPSGRLVKINELVQRLDDIVDSKAKNTALKWVDEDYRHTENLFPDFEPLEKQNEDIVDQLVIDSVDVTQYLIQYRDGALYRNQLGGVSRVNGSEISYGQLWTSTPELAAIFQTKLSLRVWQGHRGQWVVELCYGWNWLNIGTFKTTEGAPFSSESVLRFRGGKDLFDYPFSDLFVNENRAEPTTKPRTEIQTLEGSPTEEQANHPYEDFELGCSEATGSYGVEAGATRNDGFEAVGFGGCNGCDGTPIQVIHSTLLVDKEEIPLLNSDTLPSDQALAATVDANSVLVMEISPPLVLFTARQKNLDEDLGNDEVDAAGIGGEGTKEGEIDEAQFNSGAFGKRKRKEKTPREERGNKKTTPVRNVIPLEKILQVKKMRLTDAADHLKVSPSALKRACRENCIKRWPPRDIHETPAVVDEEESAPLTFDTLLSDQALMAAIDINSVVEETTPQQFSPIVRQDKPDKDSSNDKVDEVEMGGVGTGEVEMRKNEKASGGERGGVRIKIPLEEILTYSHMCIEDAAMELKVSRSTLKRICRDYNISRWPPRDEHKRIGQSSPDESPAIVDQERIPPLKSNVPLPANQVSASIDNTHSVTVRANYEDIRIKFRLSLPWRMVELEQEVKKRLQLDAGTYYIKYKDEDDGLTLIACDEDLKDCISSSSPLGTHSIEVFLSQKVAHEVRVDQL